MSDDWMNHQPVEKAAATYERVMLDRCVTGQLRPAVPHGPDEHSHGDWVIANDACPHPTCPHHRPLSLPDFLLARYDEEEAIAARADGSAWQAVSEKYPIGAFKGGHLVHVHAPRWRADVGAKRRIVSLHEHDDLDGNLSCGQCDFGGYGRQWCATLRLLALPYADHPDYREEWKP